MQVAGFISSLFVSDCGVGKFVAFVLCETGWQLTMGGQARFMCAMKMGRRGSWMRIRGGIRRQKASLLLGRKKCNFCCRRELARMYSCCVFLHCTRNYMMASFMF